MNPESAKRIAALQPLILDPNGPPTSCMATLAAIGLCDVIGPAAATIDPGKLIIVKKATYRLNLSERQRNFIRAHTQRGLK